MKGATLRFILSMWLITLVTTSVPADGSEIERGLDCGNLNDGSHISVTLANKADTDYLVGATITYKKPWGQYRSERIQVMLDFRRGVYFEMGGFDCTEPNGKGRCLHFETIPTHFQEHLNDRGSWDKIMESNIGGAISRCLKQLPK